MKKLNKKGFTLVELLAVIVILAIIVVLAVRKVLPTMNTAKTGAYKSDCKKLLNVAQEYSSLQMIDNSGSGKFKCKIADNDCASKLGIDTTNFKSGTVSATETGDVSLENVIMKNGGVCETSGYKTTTK